MRSRFRFHFYSDSVRGVALAKGKLGNDRLRFSCIFLISASALTFFGVAFHAVMETRSFGRAYQRVRQQLCLMRRTLFSAMSRPLQLAQRLTSGSPAPRVVAITRSLIPFSNGASPFGGAIAEQFFFLLVFGHRIALFSFRYIALYRPPTYLDILIGTTTPMTSTSRPDWHGWKKFHP